MLDKLVRIGLGINIKTYFKFAYPIYSGVEEYGILRVAFFGVN